MAESKLRRGRPKARRIPGYKRTEEMMEILGASQHAVNRWCRNGELDGALKRAGSWYAPSRSVRALARARGL